MPRWVERTSTCSASGEWWSRQLSQLTTPSRRLRITVTGTGMGALAVTTFDVRLQLRGRRVACHPCSDRVRGAAYDRRPERDHLTHQVGPAPGDLADDHAAQAPADQGHRAVFVRLLDDVLLEAADVAADLAPVPAESPTPGVVPQ